ncbi:hypothetical protein [Pedobacter punctiformis]|uniref:Uncharacterized protein n=1 Tax=Pedobacter punctiformis TaxID=3004097 RepID=A0ABT4LCJ3_9SPHI|nr:hypothetical protein [Pedobacter sp. HCMS5-2]MCZ4245591.1 hypothetical protein [Pedobacter sp. HCMS5-2]
MNKKAGIGATSILVVFLALGRMFIADQKEKIEAENNKLMEGIRKAYTLKKKRADFSIDSLLNAQGKIYLYTNDRSAKLAWAPNIENNNYASGKAMVYDAIMAEKFVNKKDSLGFLLLLKTGSNAIYPVNQGIFLNQSDATKKLWFVGLEDKNKKPVDAAKTKLNSDVFYTNWGIGFSDIKEINVEKLSSTSALGCIYLAKNSDSFLFYMVGYQKDNNQLGIDSTDFAKATKAFGHLLQKEGIRTNNFAVKMFNE